MRWNLRIERFVSELAAERPETPFRNPYASREAAHNLTVFLRNRERLDRTLLLVGEAPGYRGAALSGVALTSLSILTDSWADPWGAFGPTAGYRLPTHTAAVREATATMIWEAVATTCSDLPLPLTWNAVPFHPTAGSPNSNSPLAPRDLDLGERWLTWFLDSFPNAVPVAVGRRASEALDALGVAARDVRHPSRGGKSDFVAGLQRIRATAFV